MKCVLIAGFFLNGLLVLAADALAADQRIPEYTQEGFRIPQPEAVLTFPRDHASHPGFKIEWWYLTGHLYSASGERFGYQATFFRNALRVPGKDNDQPERNDQVHLTHMALTDSDEGNFYFEQRFSRDGWDAYASTERLETRNGNWSLQANQDVSKLQLQASVQSDVKWSLTLIPEKQLLRFGKDGTSRKGPSSEARSYYLTFSRMRTTGVIQMNGRRLEVTGSSWMDHEIASSQLDPSYTGWDWIAIQLKDGWEIKAYLLRQEDGSPAAYSALMWIDPEGTVVYRGHEDFEWLKTSTWKSPSTGAIYPNKPKIRSRHPLTGELVEFNFVPLLEDQELVFPGTTYWEGAGRILDASGAETGSAYLELVGYAGAIQGLR